MSRKIIAVSRTPNTCQILESHGKFRPEPARQPYVTFMSALPKEVKLDPNGVSAWNMLLAAEEAALKMVTGTSAKYRNELVGVRILGFFLLDFYKHSYHQIGLIPYQRLLKEVISCFRVSVLYMFGTCK